MEWDLLPAEWNPATWEDHGVWEAVWPLVVWCQVMVFFCLLLVATVDARLHLRRKYVLLLDRLFRFAAAKLPRHADEDDDEEDYG